MPTFSNQAQLAYNGVIRNSNVATGEIIEVLSVNKSSILDTYTDGSTITYVVNIVNAGNTAFSGLTLRDSLGAYTFTSATGTQTTLYPLTFLDDTIRYYQNGILQPTPNYVVDDALIIAGIGVPANGTTTIIYQATVNEYAPLEVQSAIVNTVTVDGTELVNPITATQTVATLNAPYLTIFKSVNPIQVSENGQVTYTFLIQNLGNTATTAADNVQILDTFSPVLSNISVTYNGTTLTDNAYAYDETTGVFSTNAGVINVPAATFEQDGDTGVWSVTPGRAEVTVTGTF